MKYNSGIILLVVLFLCFSCGKSEYVQYGFTFVNNSSVNVSFYLGVVPRENGGTLYPDTLLSEVYAGDRNIQSNGGKRNVHFYYLDESNDTLSLYIYDSDTLATYSWDEMKAGYKILRRYDINLNYLGTRRYNYIYYPPTEEMKNIKMYPPYNDSIK